jgi:hypothetical protein
MYEISIHILGNKKLPKIFYRSVLFMILKTFQASIKKVLSMLGTNHITNFSAIDDNIVSDMALDTINSTQNE